MKRVQKLIFAIIALVAIMAVTACGGSSNKGGNTATATGETTSANGTAAADQPVTLNMVTWNDVGEGTLNRAMVDAYTKLHPNVKINLSKLPEGGDQDPLMVQLAGGADIDIFETANNIGLSDYVTRGIALDLTGYIDKYHIDLTPAGSLYESNKINGKLYSLLGRKSWWALYYNKDIFDKANVPYPSNDMTWDDFRTLAKKMTSGEGKEKIYGTFNDPWLVSTTMSAVQQGKGVSSPDNDQALVDSLKYWRSLWIEDKSIKSYADIVTSKTWSEPEFESGQVAMLVGGDWNLADINKDIKDGKVKLNYDLVNPPHGPNVKAATTWSEPTSHMIYTKSKHPEEAFKFLQFMCASAEGAKIWTQYNFIPVFSTPEATENYVKLVGPSPANLKNFLSGITSVPESLPVQGLGAMEKRWSEQAELVMAADKSPEDAVKDYKKNVEKDLQK